MTTASINYVRPRAETALSDNSIFELRILQIDQHDQALVISGRVSSFYHKQLAQEAVLAVCEGLKVINSIDVE